MCIYIISVPISSRGNEHVTIGILFAASLHLSTGLPGFHFVKGTKVHRWSLSMGKNKKPLYTILDANELTIIKGYEISQTFVRSLEYPSSQAGCGRGLHSLSDCLDWYRPLCPDSSSLYCRCWQEGIMNELADLD